MTQGEEEIIIIGGGGKPRPKGSASLSEQAKNNLEMQEHSEPSDPYELAREMIAIAEAEELPIRFEKKGG